MTRKNMIKTSEDFFNLLDKKLSAVGIDTSKSQYKTKNGKKCLVTTNNQVFFIDYYLPDENIAVELYRNYWHMNPAIHATTAINKQTNAIAKDIWDFDKKRLEIIYEEFNIRTFVVWENKATATLDELSRIIKQTIDDTQRN